MLKSLLKCIYFKHYFYISLWYNTFCLWNITTKINFSQPGGVNVILQTVRQIDATQNKAVPDDPYARLFKAAPSCCRLKTLLFLIFLIFPYRGVKSGPKWR